MNVLFIAVDDLNNRIGCYGDPVVKTPNIDRFARRGVRFDRAYGNTTPPRTYLGDAVFLPEYFRAQGYFTARVGKIAHGLFEDAVSWDISESRAGVPLPARKKGPGAAQDEDNVDGGGGVPLSWTPTNRPDEQEPDGATARRIVEIIEKTNSEKSRSGKPFFIGCGFHKPHLPWVVPKKYFDMYSIDDIKLPKTPPDDRDDIPPIALTHTASDDKLTDLERRQAILAYHAATTFMDAQVGVVLDALERNKLWDNTVVVLFGDHGWHLYDHLQLWRKLTVFEESAHAPLMVYAPGKKSGAACPRLVEYVDLYPTLTALCGLPPAPAMEGISFAPLLSDPQRPWKKAAYTMVQHGKNQFGRSVLDLNEWTKPGRREDVGC